MHWAKTVYIGILGFKLITNTENGLELLEMRRKKTFFYIYVKSQ